MRGPAAYQVLQREADGTATISFSGTATAAEGQRIQARILREGRTLRNFGWKSLGEIRGTEWSGEIKAVPTGGPYRIELRVEGQTATTTIDNVLVGDLWILAGQSNMQGVGKLADSPLPHELIHNFEFNNSWRVAKEPLHNFGDAADPVRWKLSPLNRSQPMEGQELVDYMNRNLGAGPGMPFALAMLERTGVPIGLIPCAQGGSSMAQWNPEAANKGGESLYGSMLGRFKATGGKVTGMIWYQGESDVSPEVSKLFGTKFETFVSAVRRDFGLPNLPVYYVQIGRFVNPGGEAGWNRVQEAQLQAESKIGPGAMVVSVDLALIDVIHLDTASQKRLGIRLANLVCRDLFPKLPTFQSVQNGPRPLAATMSGNTVRVGFSGVNGSLRAAGRIAGFSIHDAAGELLPVLINTKFALDGKSVEIALHPHNLPDKKFPPDMALRYGYGKDPYCNITDDLDMGCPRLARCPFRTRHLNR